MPNNKEKGFTRRQFLKGAVALGASALIGSGCQSEPSSQQEKSPTKEPSPIIQSPTATKEPTAIPSPELTATPEPTSTPELTPTQEALRIPGVVISEDYLKGAFAGIGGGEIVEGSQQETTIAEFGQNYVSQSWGEEINFTSLPKDSIASLKYLISLGAYQGVEGVFRPGKQNGEVVFPQLADLSLARITLESVPPEEIQKTQEHKEGITPKNFCLSSGTQMTVIGTLERSQIEQETGIGKDDFGNKLNYALVAFTDYLRADKETGAPRHYLAIIPTHFPNDPENKNTLSLANHLEANGYSFDPETNEIIFTDHDKQVALGLNFIEGEKLAQDLEKACGIYFVDQIDGERIKNPVVPHPDEIPKYWAVIERRDEEGNTGLFLYGAEEKGTEMREIAQARYDEEKKEWGWEKIEPTPELTPTLSPEEEQQLREDILRLFPGEKSEGAQEILKILEEIKKYDPQKPPEDLIQYTYYTTILSTLVGEYYASGDNPESRNSEILKILAKIREMARENPNFKEDHWQVEGVDSY